MVADESLLVLLKHILCMGHYWIYHCITASLCLTLISYNPGLALMIMNLEHPDRRILVSSLTICITPPPPPPWWKSIGTSKAHFMHGSLLNISLYNGLTLSYSNILQSRFSSHDNEPRTSRPTYLSQFINNLYYTPPPPPPPPPPLMKVYWYF